MLLLIRARFCIVSLCWYMFCLLVVLVKLSVLAKCLARKTPLRKPLTVVRGSSAQSPGQRVFMILSLVYCFIFYDVSVLSSGPM